MYTENKEYTLCTLENLQTTNKALFIPNCTRNHVITYTKCTVAMITCMEKNMYILLDCTFLGKVFVWFILINDRLGLFASAVWEKNFIEPWISLLIVKKVYKLVHSQVWLFLCTTKKKSTGKEYLGTYMLL